MKIFKVELNKSIVSLKFDFLVVELNIYLEVLLLLEHSIFKYPLRQILQIPRSTRCVSTTKLVEKFSRSSEGIKIPAIFLPICIKNGQYLNVKPLNPMPFLGAFQH